MMYGSPMAPQSVAYATQDVRMAFVRKVYGLFFASVLTTVAISWLSMLPALMDFTLAMRLPFRIIAFIMVCVMAWGKQKSGLNMVLLYGYSALMGFVMGPLFWIYNQISPGATLEAGTLATLVFGGLTAYVMFTRQDFNWLGGFLFCALITLIVAGLFMCLFGVAAMTTLYCVVGILIFSGFVLYDTSRIMTRMSLEDAPIAALELHLDFWNLVRLILFLVGGRRQ